VNTAPPAVLAKNQPASHQVAALLLVVLVRPAAGGHVIAPLALGAGKFERGSLVTWHRLLSFLCFGFLHLWRQSLCCVVVIW